MKLFSAAEVKDGTGPRTRKCKRQARCSCHPWPSAHLKVKLSEIIIMIVFMVFLLHNL